MTRIKTIAGFRRALFLPLLETTIFFHFLPALFTGRLSVRRFATFLKRLLFFLTKLQHNKFVRFDSATRLDLYVPNFPTRAFYTACEKFAVFGRSLPCATALISVTSACRYRCAHCYQQRDKGKDMPIETLINAVRQLQDMGIAFFNIEGGEPFLTYDRLKAVCTAIDNRSEIWVNATGDGMTLDRLRELRQNNLTAIMFSLHTADPVKLNSFMQSDSAWNNLERGVSLCHQAGVPVAFNTCLNKEDFSNGEFEKVMEQARAWNGCLVQLIKPKPAGGRMDKGVEGISSGEIDTIKKKINTYNHDRAYRNFPAISAQMIEECPEVFGCTAGGTDRFYINAKGDVQPCEFLNISFGNIVTEDFTLIYERMRACFNQPGQTWLCEAYAEEIRSLAGAEPVLPLTPEQSKTIYTTWNRGKRTELYERVGD
jgi:MoaA/NifB/PqqE/SkfB family radical SAM enzyme